MAGPPASAGRPPSRVRIAVWASAALLLLAPWLAMQVTDDAPWTSGDFLLAGVLLFGACLTYELIARTAENRAYRTAVGIAMGATLFLVWLSLGVGIIGRDGDPANLMYAGVLAVGILGALIARLRPRGMARTLVGMALAQAMVAAIALRAGLGYPWSGPLELTVLNGIFVMLFVGAAWLFRRAAQERS